MEVICPVCRRLIEIPDLQALTGNRCRCKKCWETFFIESTHPLRIRVETPEERINRPRVTPRVSWRGEEHDDD